MSFILLSLANLSTEVLYLRAIAERVSPLFILYTEPVDVLGVVPWLGGDIKPLGGVYLPDTFFFRPSKSVMSNFAVSGFSGADIANVCNEAALIAARKSKKSGFYYPKNTEDFLVFRYGDWKTPVRKWKSENSDKGYILDERYSKLL